MAGLTSPAARREANGWLRMRSIEKRFGGVAALRSVDLEVRTGEVHALVGENGAGKSTLMGVLAGSVSPDQGEMTLFGTPYRPRGPRDALERGVAMVYQELNLAADLSVEDNLFLGREHQRFFVRRRAADRPLARRALDRLGLGALDPTTPVRDLGPGPRQLVEIARALVANAQVVVLDEPTSSLSRMDAERLFDAIGRLRREGLAVIYISHFLEEVEKIADRYTVLRDGRTVETGEITEGAAATMLTAMTGRTIEELFPRVPHEPGEVALEAVDLAGSPLPKHVSFRLHRGEILGIGGLVGAGRTELLRTLFGLAPPRGGQIRVFGRADSGRTPPDRLAQGMALLSEDRRGEGLAQDRPIAENVTLGDLRRYSRGGVLNRSRRDELVKPLLTRLEIRCTGPGQPVGELSGGNQQKVAFGRLLYNRAEILLLDEPTRGVDVGSKIALYRQIGEAAANGKAVLLVSSYLPELLGVADRIAVMHRGTLGEPRPVSDWTETSLLDAASRGESPRREREVSN